MVEENPSSFTAQPVDGSMSVDRADVAADARAIWQAGVAAVDSAQLVRNVVKLSGSQLRICGEQFDLSQLDRLIVVGAGKASAGMARGLEQVLGPEVLRSRVSSWINVPEDCVVPLQQIHLHAARPAGLNEATEAGVTGSRRIVELVASLGPRDLCLVLLSGGGSALLPLPVDGIRLADKQAVTRMLSCNGASIHELNAVRKRLSQIKGGGLLHAARAGRLITLIISDVVGDPLDVIASGPTVCDSGTAEQAIAILKRFARLSPGTAADSSDAVPAAVWDELQRQVACGDHRAVPSIRYENHVIGNNQTALHAAIRKAEELGYEVRSLGSQRQGIAHDVGRELADLCLQACRAEGTRPVCWIGGGEPVVQLAPTDRPRKGGRNQEAALAAVCRLWETDLRGIAILSGGTDGEDGPTDAAGAVCSEAIIRNARRLGLDPFDALSINNSYPFFSQAQGLIQTGPTHTNVMDLQVALWNPSSVGR